MKKIYIFILIPIVLSSCISTAKFNQYVYQGYSNLPKINKQNNNESVSIRTDELDDLEDLLVKSEKQKSYFIPAIIFWTWNTTIKCELSPTSVADRFNTSFISYADLFSLQQKLNGQRLELSLESVPNSFVYTSKGTILFLINSLNFFTLQAIIPEKQELIFSYKLFDGTNETKNGSISIDRYDQPMKQNGRSLENFIGFYINQYNEDLTSMSKDALAYVLKELTQKEVSKDNDSIANRFVSTSGKAILYIFRLNDEIGERLKVNCDDKFIGSTGAKNYVYTVQDTGKHIIESIGENNDKLEMDLEPDKIYYIEQVPMMGWKPRTRMVILDEKEGQEKLNKCQLSGDSVEK